MAEHLVVLLLLLWLQLRRRGTGAIFSSTLPIILLLSLIHHAFLDVDVLLRLGQGLREVSEKLLRGEEIKITSTHPPLQS